MRKVYALALALALGLFVAACGDGGKAAADAAIKAVETAFAEIQADALQYVPDQAKGVQDAIAAVKDLFTKGEFTKALEETKGLTAKIAELKDAAAAKKAELTKSWDTLNTGMPDVLKSIQAKIDELSKAKKLPANMTKDSFAAAKTAFDAVNQAWAQAGDVFKSGKLVDAVAMAQKVKTQVGDVLKSLGMELPAFLQ